MTSSSGLDAMNEASDERAAGLLAACNASPGWVAQVLAHRPYRDIASLLDTGERVARSLSWTEVCRALDAHPRIGDRATGDSTEAEWSRREQSSVATSDAGTQDALRRGNEAYEQRFGHVFLVRADGRTPDEMVAELHRRLGNDDLRERAEVTDQLAQITRLRLEKAFQPRQGADA
jgi:2-oxo-4-hydroxy-4-carboxy-5-ureidoimidazoline decarboxylase